MIFIGHGSDPVSPSQIPPSSDKNTGRLIFFNRGNLSSTNTKYDDLSDFQPAAGKTLFICQACYSGNTVNKMAKSMYVRILMYGLGASPLL